MAIYQPPQSWQGRNDGDEIDVQRWHQVIGLINVEAGIPASVTDVPGVALIGFCSDEGVRRNEGRVGARTAPAHIRRACSNFAVHFSTTGLFDAGDIICDDSDLEAAQFLLGEKVGQLIKAGYMPVVLGGGHEVAFANFSGIYPGAGSNRNFGVINFDAHFDLRKTDANIGATSGTGFWQMAQEVKSAGNNFEYLVIGLQQCCNTKRLFQTATELDAIHIFAEEFTSDQLEHVLHLINGVLYQSSIVQLSIDMDVFAAAVAPGVSAPAFSGILPGIMFKRLLRHIIQSGKLTSIDIAEVNPLFDIDNRTSRLAASLIFDMVAAMDGRA